MIPDVNVLLNAFRKELPHHEAAKVWLNETINGNEAVGIVPIVLTGFLRISTNPRFWTTPSIRAEVISFADVLVNRGIVLEVSGNYWDVFRSLLDETKASGDIVTDISIAATAIVHGAQIATYDRDFAKLPGVSWFSPGS